MNGRTPNGSASGRRIFYNVALFNFFKREDFATQNHPSA